MKHTLPILLLAASVVAASAQTSTTTATKPATTAKASQAATPAAKLATTAKAGHTATAAKPATKSAKTAKTAEKLPFGVPAPGIPAVQTAKKTLFTASLRYQEIKVGEGAEAEPGKIYKILYTGWLAADGHKFDSTDDHPRSPLKNKEGKPLLGADGQPVQGPPQPISFPQGFGRVIPGFDQGFAGMKVGGQRRLFIPWQLAYGAKGRPGPEAAHPGIPPKADLIFDVELVDVTDLPTAPARSTADGMRPMTGAPAAPARPNFATPSAPGATPNPAAPAKPTAPAAPATTAAPAATASKPAPDPAAQVAAPAAAATATPATAPAPAATATPAQAPSK